VPLLKVGKLTLNKATENYFEEWKKLLFTGEYRSGNRNSPLTACCREASFHPWMRNGTGLALTIRSFPSIRSDILSRRWQLRAGRLPPFT
jgi:hypothetical protein